MATPLITLKRRRARPFFAGHPWVFESSIETIPNGLEAGAEVALASSEGQFIARGLYNPASAIRVRLYRWEDRPLDRDFWAERIQQAVRLRRDLLRFLKPRQACRLIASEGDGLSGLTVDCYDRYLAVRFSSRALHLRQDLLLDLLTQIEGVEGLFARTERGVADREGLPPHDAQVRGVVPTSSIAIEEHGIVYRIALESGQKTGFYLDQRENRLAAARYCQGRRVLDLFCYTGGFSLSALLLGGAAEALGIDSSAAAIEQARENARLNGLGTDRVRFQQGDVFDVLEQLQARGEQFGVVVCDPPKFAPSAGDLEHATKRYIRLNRAALALTAPDGVFVTCSCSGAVDRLLFGEMAASAAEGAGCSLQILENRGAAADHPVAANCLESEYLKCLIARVLPRSGSGR